MPLQISIVPLESTLDIYGPPDTTAAYSLAGHVSLSFSSRLSIFDRGRSEKLLLHSLELTFEGQSELVSDGGGYSAARVCSITKELIDGEPLLISNEDELASLDTKKTPSPRWDVVFNIPIPGWLPATSAFGQFFNDMESGTKYTLYAKATFRDLNAAKSPTLPTLLCGLFRPYSRTMRSTPCPIIIRRLYISPCRSECALDEVQPFPRTTYTVKTSVKRAMDREFADHELIPVDVLAGIDIKVDIPESLSVFEDVPVTLSTRLSPALTEDQRRRVGLVGFKMDIQQAETYTTDISQAYQSRFPIPPESRQPPNVPLLSARSLDQYFALGILGPPQEGTSTTLEYSLIDEKMEARSFEVDDSTALGSSGRDWASYSVDLDLDKKAPREANSIAEDKAHPRGFRMIRSHYDSPHLRVRHQLVVAVLCSYEHDNAEGSDEPLVAFEALNFTIPLHFVLPGSAPTVSPFSPLVSPIRVTDPYSKQTMKIPAYSQLFYSNGDPREDLWEATGEQLPVYEKEQPSGLDIDFEGIPLLMQDEA